MKPDPNKTQPKDESAGDAENKTTAKNANKATPATPNTATAASIKTMMPL